MIMETRREKLKKAAVRYAPVIAVTASVTALVIVTKRSKMGPTLVKTMLVLSQEQREAMATDPWYTVAFDDGMTLVSGKPWDARK